MKKKFLCSLTGIEWESDDQARDTCGGASDKVEGGV
jgi:hypothetical protein